MYIFLIFLLTNLSFVLVVKNDVMQKGNLISLILSGLPAFASRKTKINQNMTQINYTNEKGKCIDFL